MTTPPNITAARFNDRQYKTANNLNARIRLHQECSVNPYGWQPWLFDQVALAPGQRVLELGCGAGNFWTENAARLPNGLNAALSDRSAGMVRQTRQAVSGLADGFSFSVIDAQHLPFPTGWFDVIIANHVLFHLPDRPHALAEIRRALKPGGMFYASTIGKDHLAGLYALARAFDPTFSWGTAVYEAFGLENGAAQLQPFFADARIAVYPDELRVTDPGVLVDYILSNHDGPLPPERLAALQAQIVQAIQSAPGGALRIAKSSGVFIAQG